MNMFTGTLFSREPPTITASSTRHHFRSPSHPFRDLPSKGGTGAAPAQQTASRQKVTPNFGFNCIVMWTSLAKEHSKGKHSKSAFVTNLNRSPIKLVRITVARLR